MNRTEAFNPLIRCVAVAALAIVAADSAADRDSDRIPLAEADPDIGRISVYLAGIALPSKLPPEAVTKRP